MASGWSRVTYRSRKSSCLASQDRCVPGAVVPTRAVGKFGAPSTGRHSLCHWKVLPRGVVRGRSPTRRQRGGNV
ncbi:hypothetical protein HPB52_007443 [Rhipicephalus sanguineus]|uniref:Uncharacterized protein n=1 Tax=Rhipicephalus sanguineus TaxID=34632 RepID=A0A9D4PCX6_RHISA|nr:hypothetical protein HPB52_007443 [Rhipicephalus sanguineus]